MKNVQYDTSPRRAAAAASPCRAVPSLMQGPVPKMVWVSHFSLCTYIYIQLWLVRVVRYIGRMRKDTQTEKAHARGLYTYICIMYLLNL